VDAVIEGVVETTQDVKAWKARRDAEGWNRNADALEDQEAIRLLEDHGEK